MSELTAIAEWAPDQQDGFAAACAAGERPAIWRGGARSWTAVREWTLDSLKARFGDQRMRVRGSDQALDVFFGTVQEREMCFADYLDEIAGPRTAGPRPYLGNFLVNHPLMVPEVLGLLDDVAFPDFFPHLTDRQFRIWVAGAGQRSTIHNDNYENINTQIIGTKSFLLFAPEEHACLYAEKVNDGLWSSPIDTNRPDRAAFPRFGEAKGWHGTLQGGDLIYIPRFWWHQVSSETISINVNVWYFIGGGQDETWEGRIQTLADGTSA